MSDNYQELAFDSIKTEAAESTMDQAIRWMMTNGYISEDLSDCVYGSEEGLGHRPGPRWRDIVDEAEEQRSWDLWSQGTGRPAPKASEMMGRFLELWTNGVSASSKRGLANAGSNCQPETEGACPACHTKSAPSVDFVELVDLWWRGEERGLTCPHCHVASRVEDWDWQPDFALAEANITFWNWPHLSAEAIARLSAALGGVRIRHLHGHL